MGRVLYIDDNGNSGYKNAVHDNETLSFYIQGPSYEYKDAFNSEYYTKPRSANNAQKPKDNFRLRYNHIDHFFDTYLFEIIDKILRK